MRNYLLYSIFIKLLERFHVEQDARYEPVYFPPSIERENQKLTQFTSNITSKFEHIEDGIFPDCFKTAKVLPLYKKGGRKDPGNYRPIILFSSLRKSFEKLLHKRMMKFCESNNLLHGAQFGFRSKMSCVHAITTVTEYIRAAIENKQSGQSCFIDLQKAFDTLNHEILLRKMQNYSFRGKILSFIASFLKERRQFVYHNGRTTSQGLITTGVPQGSVLGPFLFLLYINDLPTIIEESQVMIFADDTSLLKSGKKGALLLQPDVERLSNWFTSNKLSINVGKCEIISFGNGVPQEPHILEKPFTYTKSCKYLGLHLNESLRVRKHIDYVVKNLNKFCGLIYRIREQNTRSSLLMFYNSFAKSDISYALLFYGTATKTNLMKVKMLDAEFLEPFFSGESSIP